MKENYFCERMNKKNTSLAQTHDCEQKTDEELVRLVLQDKEYYLCVMQRYEEKLFHYICRSSRLGKEECEDILQNAFLKIYINLHDFDLSLKFSSWIYRIVHNEMIDYLRKNKMHHETLPLEMEEEDEISFIEILHDDTDMGKELDDTILQENIQELLQKLPVHYREVLVLKYLEQKDYQEISDILRMPMGTVATLLHRAKKMMKEKITTLSPHLQNL